MWFDFIDFNLKHQNWTGWFIKFLEHIVIDKTDLGKITLRPSPSSLLLLYMCSRVKMLTEIRCGLKPGCCGTSGCIITTKELSGRPSAEHWKSRDYLDSQSWVQKHLLKYTHSDRTQQQQQQKGAIVICLSLNQLYSSSVWFLLLWRALQVHQIHNFQTHISFFFPICHNNMKKTRTPPYSHIHTPSSCKWAPGCSSL